MQFMTSLMVNEYCDKYRYIVGYRIYFLIILVISPSLTLEHIHRKLKKFITDCQLFSKYIFSCKMLFQIFLYFY